MRKKMRIFRFQKSSWFNPGWGLNKREENYQTFELSFWTNKIIQSQTLIISQSHSHCLRSRPLLPWLGCIQTVRFSAWQSFDGRAKKPLLRTFKKSVNKSSVMPSYQITSSQNLEQRKLSKILPSSYIRICNNVDESTMAWHMSPQSYTRERIERGMATIPRHQFNTYNAISMTRFSRYGFSLIIWKQNTFLQVTRQTLNGWTPQSFLPPSRFME